MTLTQLFTNIANAIRAKTGTSATIQAEDFPTEIAMITTGNLTDAEYEMAMDDLDDILEDTTLTPIYPPNWSNIGYSDTPPSIITAYNYAKNIYDNWNASTTSLQGAYQNNLDVIIFPLINTSNVTNMVSMFYNCTYLRDVPLLNTENVTNMVQMFYSCSSIKDIPLFNTSKCINLNNFVANVTSLTNQSLDNILQMCINSKSSGYIGTKTLAGVGISSRYYSSATIQALPHYQAFINAGWTIGY